MRLLRFPSKAVISLNVVRRAASLHVSATRRTTLDEMAAKSQTPAVPRPSASLIVINPRNEILFVHRNPKSGSFAGMHVFPGGNYDTKQDDNLAITAIRETFEESGLLLASSRGKKRPRDEELDSAREKIHSHQELFKNFLDAHEMTADVSSLMPFTQWTTPVTQPRRFQTQFFITFLEAAPASGFSSGDKLERLPTPDGGQEVIAARFLHPAAAIREMEAHTIALMPPQFYLITTLLPILQGDRSTPQQRERVAELCSGPFGRMRFNPLPLPPPYECPKGWGILTYEGDEARGGPKGRLHRSMVKFAKGGTVSEVVLQRNFDIFNEPIEPDASVSAKL